MADLKKVGLVYKADGSTDFVKSIKAVNSELRENYQQMRITQSSWDENTKASEKLISRQNNLTKAYDLQKNKLAVLNEELEHLKQSEKATEDQIKSKEAQIKSTEAEMANYERRLKGIAKALPTADIKQMGRELQQTGDQFTKVGKTMSVFSAAYAGAMGVAIKKASDWESAWVDVLKVTDGTEKQLADLSKGIRKMSQELPVSANEIAGVVEAASKLGVGIDDVEAFAETMVKMEIATGISASDSATAIARFAEITRMSFDDVDRLGSVVAELGDNYATTEKEIIDMSMGLAAAGSQVGMHQSDIMALATALSSVGLEAQAGGSAMSKLMVNMELATKTGKGLTDFADVAGMSGEEFAKVFEQDATEAIAKFIKGLDNINKDGGSAIQVLDDMGIKEVRLRDTLLRAANASDTFTGAIRDGSKAWEENTKLNREAEIQADTLANQWQVTKNMLEEVAITFGEIAMPVIKDFVENLQILINKFQEMSPTVQKTIVIIGGLIAVVGPILIFIGKIITSVGILIEKLAFLGPVIAKIGAFILGLNPVILAIGAVIAGLAFIIYKNWSSIKEWTLALIDSISEKFQAFKEWFTELWTSIKEWFVDGFTAVWEWVIEKLEAIITPITDIIDSIVDFFKNVGLLMIALFAIMLEKIWDFFEPFVTKIKEWINTLGNFISGVFEAVKDKIIIIVQKIQSVWQTTINFIKSNVISPLINFFSGVFNNIWNVISSVIQRIRSAFEVLGNAVTSVFSAIKNTVVNIFSSISGIIKAPINGIISAINSALRAMNKIKIPSWVPGLGGAGINFPMIQFLAKGGNLLGGAAIVGERGPELLESGRNKTTVTPLSDGGGAKKRTIDIDYKKNAKAIANEFIGMRFVLDGDGFIRLIDDRLLEVL